jgi:trimeric autotransporter adhesin
VIRGAEFFFLTRWPKFFTLGAVWNRGQGRKPLPGSFLSPFSDLRSQGQPNREKKGIQHMNQLIWSKNFTTLIVLGAALACFGLGSPVARAVSPPPDGGYAGQNTAEGTDALFSLTTGVWNVAVGFQALHSDTTGNQNTATGYQALFNNISGNKSTAYGAQALFHNTTGNDNVATGFGTLFTNVSGNRNTGVGYRTLTFNNADDNTAIGWNALYNNTTGVQNTAIGSGALAHGNGSDNTATGYQALNSNTTGKFNDAVGANALFSNVDGFSNNAFGDSALYFNVHASENTALGDLALEFNDKTGAGKANGNTAIGASALVNNVDGNHNTALGAGTGTDPGIGSNNIYIGDPGFNGDNNVISIGGIAASGTPYENTYIGGIYNTVVNDRAVYIASDGHVGTLASSRRYKEDIKPMDNVSEALFALKPVVFRYKQQIDPEHKLSFGLIAEDVAQISPDLVSPDKEGRPQTVRYEAVNAMLLNEFLKEHGKVEEQNGKLQKQARKIKEQEGMITQLKKEMGNVVAHIKEQDSKIQKVSARLEMVQPAPKMAANAP